MIFLKRVDTFRRPLARDTQPFMKRDLSSLFFLIVRPAFTGNCTLLCVGFFSLLLDLTRSIRTISPLMLNLYLNPLYSTLGGSTIRAEPFTKNPIDVDFLWNPLYNWKIFIHLTLVLSVTNSHDSLNNINTVSELIGIAPMEVRLWADFKTT